MGRIPNALKETALLKMGEDDSEEINRENLSFIGGIEDSERLIVQEANKIYSIHLLEKIEYMKRMELKLNRENIVSYQDSLEGIIKFAENNVKDMSNLLDKIPLINQINNQRDYSIIIRQHLFDYYLV